MHWKKKVNSQSHVQFHFLLFMTQYLASTFVRPNQVERKAKDRSRSYYSYERYRKLKHYFSSRNHHKGSHHPYNPGKSPKHPSLHLWSKRCHVTQLANHRSSPMRQPNYSSPPAANTRGLNSLNSRKQKEIVRSEAVHQKSLNPSSCRRVPNKPLRRYPKKIQ